MVGLYRPIIPLLQKFLLIYSVVVQNKQDQCANYYLTGLAREPPAGRRRRWIILTATLTA